LSSRVVLKVDVDTYRGTLQGVPRLLDLFAREDVRATFFFSLGPDTSGKAIKRVLKKGFVKKVLSARPAVSYGWKTMLHGTLLPAPDIGADPKCVERMREVRAAGHECGIHAWDHVDWHDRLPAMSREEITHVVGRCHARFFDIFGVPAVLSAAPGWTATALSVEVQEAHGIAASSDTRGGEPFFPLKTNGRPAKYLEVPTTLPTLDELLGLPEYRGQPGSIPDFLRKKVIKDRVISVHSIHTEIEGGRAFGPLFQKQVRGWKSDGVTFLTLGQAAIEAKIGGALPRKALRFTTLPGRATPVATGA
jgi:peptidoglycan/xylan/chitin deacetylase (PgdA/CDA1 family)